MKIALILTNDWELFGDGSGNYFEIQHEPLKQMLKWTKKFNSKITVMAEVGQQFSHKKIEEYGFAKDIVESWAVMVKDVIRSGNDVQLHYHPQWEGAEYNEEWKLTEKWSIASYETQQIHNFLKSGKDYLETLLKPIKPNYTCNCFRAGAYYIEPSEKVIKVLLELGFKCDTSVTKGLSSNGHYNYNDAYSNVIPWYVNETGIKYSGNTELLEIPIFSFKGYDSEVLKKFLPKLYYKIKYGIIPTKEELNWVINRDIIKNKRYPIKNRLYKKSQKKDLVWYMQALLKKKYTQLDYDYIPASIFVENLKKVLKDRYLMNYFGDNYIPIVASGHVKDMHTPYNFKRILELINSDLSDDIEYWTLSEALHYFKKR